jgi:uncharacterized protein YutE (UPF0331/DUF86 family)
MTHRNRAVTLFEGLAVDRIIDGAFDSWARSQQIAALYRHEQSLVLLLSGSGGDWTYDRCQQAALTISKVLDSPPARLDCAILNNSPPQGAFAVISEGRLLWEADRRARIEYEARAISQFLDYPYAGAVGLEACLERDMVAAVCLLMGVRGQPQALLFSDHLRAYGVQHALQIAIGALIGLVRINLERNAIPVPERDIDALQALAGPILSPELAEQLSSLVELYDQLVHRHWEVDPDVVNAVVRDRLDEFRQFRVDLNSFYH